MDIRDQSFQQPTSAPPGAIVEGARDVHRLVYPSAHSRSDCHEEPTLQLPQRLISFSSNPSRVLEFNDSALRYYIDPPDNADLRYGYDRWIRRPEEKGRLDNLLKALVKAKETIPGKTLRDSIVTWRGVTTKILTAPYEDRDRWEMNVMFVDNTFYFQEHLSDEKLREKENLSPRSRQQTYFGYSFESFCTTSTPDPRQQRGWGGDVDTNVQWCSVVETRLGNKRLLIGGEVDCVRAGRTDNYNTLVELKTNLSIRGPPDEARFEKKLLKIYFQSLLLDVPEIVVGFRTPAGRLTTVQSFKTRDIPDMIRHKPHAWDPNVCLRWGTEFITFLERIVKTQISEEEVWRVKFAPHMGVEIHLLDNEGVDEVQAGERDRSHGFLPNWYWEEMKMGRPSHY